MEKVGKVSDEESTTSIKLFGKLIEVPIPTQEKGKSKQEETTRFVNACVPKKKRGWCNETSTKPNSSEQRNSKKERVMVSPNQIFDENQDVGEAPAAVSVELRAKIEREGGTDIKLLIQKKLFSSDLDENKNRLSMPEKQVRVLFLKEEEKKAVEKDPKRGIAVKLLEPCGYASDVSLRMWKKSYVLTSKWNEVRTRKGNRELGVFELNNIIRVWSFRVNDKLWMTIEKVAAGEEEISSISA